MVSKQTQANHEVDRLLRHFFSGFFEVEVLRIKMGNKTARKRGNKETKIRKSLETIFFLQELPCVIPLGF